MMASPLGELERGPLTASGDSVPAGERPHIKHDDRNISIRAQAHPEIDVEKLVAAFRRLAWDRLRKLQAEQDSESKIMMRQHEAAAVSTAPGHGRPESERQSVVAQCGWCWHPDRTDGKPQPVTGLGGRALLRVLVRPWRVGHLVAECRGYGGACRSCAGVRRTGCLARRVWRPRRSGSPCHRPGPPSAI